MGMHRPFGGLWAQVEKKHQHDRAPEATRLSLSIPCPMKGLLFSIKLQETGMVCTHQRHSTLCLPQLLIHVRNWQTSQQTKTSWKMLIFLYCCISELQEGRRINRHLKCSLVVCSSLGTRVHFTQQFVHQSVSVQGTLAAAASFPGPLLLCERWRNVKQRPRRAPRSQDLQGCCYCSSLWLTLAATTGDKWHPWFDGDSLPRQTLTQTARLGLSIQGSGCKILQDPILQHAWSPSASVLCRWTSCFPCFCVSHGTGLHSLVPATIPSPARLSSAATMGNLAVWGAWGCLTEQWDIPRWDLVCSEVAGG